MAKKEFSWTSERLVKTVEISEYEKREIRVCTLKDKEFVSFTTVKKIKDSWMPTSGYTIPKAFWTEIVDALESSDLEAAFGSSNITAVKDTLKAGKGKWELIDVEPKAKKAAAKTSKKAVK